jgi:hypothetical protein
VLYCVLNCCLYFYVEIVFMGPRAEHACVEARVIKCSFYFYYYIEFDCLQIFSSSGLCLCKAHMFFLDVKLGT